MTDNFQAFLEWEKFVKLHLSLLNILIFVNEGCGVELRLWYANVRDWFIESLNDEN